MLNRKYFPFERNSYYFGKLLTAKDFEAEQRYFNDKRRLNNRLSGSGIISGLGVVMADDTSVIIQAGCAIDPSGREIVVPDTRVVKLSTVDGYGDLESTCAYLAIGYDEQPGDEVYAPMSTGEPQSGKNYNKVLEGFKLSLLDENLVTNIPDPLDEFVSPVPIYADHDITITQYTPRFVPLDSNIVIRAVIRKVGRGLGEYSFSYDLDAQEFALPDGENRLAVVANGLRLAHGDSRSYTFVLTPKAHVWGVGNVTISAGNIVIQKDGEVFTVNNRHECTLKTVDRDIVGHYLSSWYQKSMDTTLDETYDEKLWIAKISLIRQKSSVIIDKVEPPPYGQYAYNSQQLMQIKRLESFYPGAGKTAGTVSFGEEPLPGAAVSVADTSDGLRFTASGVFDLGLGLGYGTKEPVFSEEIMHGLGRGPVYVEIGVEYLTGSGGTAGSEIILGNPQIFASEDKPHDGERIYNLSTAVKVLPERGTFIVGVHPYETSDLISLRIRWFAMRFNEVNKQIKTSSDGSRYILINPDTIVVPPKGTAHITPVFINMPGDACRYQMMDAEGGSVDNNGVYTAPAKEGVYEVRVEAMSDPMIYAHAFVIVTQKKKDAAGR